MLIMCCKSKELERDKEETKRESEEILMISISC